MTTSRTVPACGNLLIDHQHGRLTELIRKAAMCARGEVEQFRPAVLAFRAALVEHFGVEGIILRGAGFAQAAAHDAAHASILEEVDRLVRVLPDPASSPRRHDVIEAMERILFEHELLEDSAYWEAIREGASQPAVAWESGLETGVGWIDDQHRHLVAILNELGVAATLHGKETLIAELMERFLRHARQHFAAEERQLDAWKLTVSAHRAEHAQLLEAVETLALAVGGDPRTLVNHYLRFWMIDHIRTADMADFAGRG